MQGPRFNPCLGNEIPRATAKSSNAATKIQRAATKIQRATTKTWNSQVNKLIIKKKKKSHLQNFLETSSIPFGYIHQFIFMISLKYVIKKILCSLYSLWDIPFGISRIKLYIAF